MDHLILLHGALGSKEQLLDLENILSDRFIIYQFNFAGHGGEPMADKAFSIQGFADSLEQFIVSNHIENPSVFGYSMGGYVALYAAARRTLSFKKIITLATKFAWDPVIAKNETAMLDAETMQQKLPAFVDMLAKRHAPMPWQEHLQLTATMMLDLGDQPLLNESELKKIDAPCLLLLGDKDKMVSREETIAVAEKLPDGVFELLDNTSHPIEKADMAVLADRIRSFLGDR
jgi:pimeloyl-ACP methyl ester carboxylesterase